METAPREFTVGQSATVARLISDADIRIMAELTGDTNPLHLDDEYARGTRFGGRIAHGVFCMGLISAVLGSRLPGPGAVYLGSSIRFTAPVRPGDVLRATVTVTSWNPVKRIIVLAARCEVEGSGLLVATGDSTLLVE
jgi:3-hydroxybutyryl-CoA dehydratase